MSAHSSVDPAPAQSARRAAAAESEKGSGWVGFAGVMLGIVGTLNVVYGIAAIDDANVYVADTRYVFGDLNTWGWFLTLLGVLQFAAAFGIFSGATWAKWVGILSASGNAILQLLFLPAFPLLSISLLAIDILVIYGLIAYGGRRATV
jgi:hypothetical protein